MTEATTTARTVNWLPGVLLAGAAAVAAWGVHTAIPAIPLLTVAIALGILTAQLPAVARRYDGSLAPGLAVSARRMMRLGIVLLGLQLSLGAVVALGWVTIAGVVAVVLVTFAATWGLGRLLRMPATESLLLAAGFAICGASAIGAMSAAIGAKDRDAATPVALVTLCGTLAMFVLPALSTPLGLDPIDFGRWAGASVHDVGQVVATAQVAGTAALAIAVTVKLVRVLMLAPMVAVAAVVQRRRRGSASKLPPVLPLFVVGFVAAAVLRTTIPLPDGLLEAAGVVQTILLAMALFALGTAVRLPRLLRTGWRAVCVALLAWIVVAALALGLVLIA